MNPLSIEEKSFEIIRREMGERATDPRTDFILQRVIHATADFDYCQNLTFSSDAPGALLSALAGGADVIADTTMVQAGINKRVLAALGGRALCYIADPDVAAEAGARGVTRARVAMEKAARRPGPLVFAIGNAPTALFSLCDLIAGGLSPAFVIGAPVGFVNVVEAKEALMRQPIPWIVARGRKGGSGVAAAIVNAALYRLRERED